MQDGAQRFGWDKRKPGRPACATGAGWSGMGMAAAIRGNFLLPAEASVTIRARRTAVVEMDMTDIGTGTYTIFAQIAAETGWACRSTMSRCAWATAAYPVTPGSGGSFGAASCGAAPARRLPQAQGAARFRRERAGPLGDRPGEAAATTTRSTRSRLRRALRRGRRRGDHRRGPAAPHAGRVRRRPHPERQDGALAADRRHDLGRRARRSTRTPSSIRASAPSSPRTSPTTSCPSTPTSARSTR